MDPTSYLTHMPFLGICHNMGMGCNIDYSVDLNLVVYQILGLKRADDHDIFRSQFDPGINVFFFFLFNFKVFKHYPVEKSRV